MKTTSSELRMITKERVDEWDLKPEHRKRNNEDWSIFSDFSSSVGGKLMDISDCSNQLRETVCGDLIAVLTIDDLNTCVDLARALVAGGVRTLEVTLRTEHAIAAIEKISSQVDGAIVGAGTVLEPDQVNAVSESGANFGVSPGLSWSVVEAAQRQEFPFLPGASTVSEVCPPSALNGQIGLIS